VNGSVKHSSLLQYNSNYIRKIFILKASQVSNRKNSKSKFIAFSHHSASAPDMSGLYYKIIMMVNDASSVISEWRHNLEHHSEVINYDPRGII